MTETTNGNGGGQLDLLGTFEVHLILGVERSRIARFLHDNEDGNERIAPPVAVLRCGPIWLRSQIEETARRMHAESGTSADFDKWLVARAKKRAEAAGLSDAELAQIIRRPVGRAKVAA